MYRQELYRLEDVNPQAVADDESTNFPFIGGIDSENDDPEYNHNCVRIISYYHTSQWDGLYTIYNYRSVIHFYIDNDGKVVAFCYDEISQRC